MAGKENRPLTDKQYVTKVEKKGNICPKCGSDAVEGGSVEINGAEASQAVSCNSCPATWTDVYHLVGYSNLVA